ncbi:hypothetical protein CAEBREN_05734 [Caenorhabditis brenneri]|uniref:Uncharacterized protein n=1 Tax=Caenorhabditis brenneri TaxID=135651 RepID=G0P2H1_CAEBE|nr:hypothetical protein CAEBREN_05734 [Caenorhabditis brenneri]
MNFCDEESSALDVATTIWHPPMTLDLLNGESDTKQTSSDGQDLAQSLVSTTTATDSHDPASNDCPGESDKSSSADLKLSSQSGVDDKKKVDCSNRMICHKNVSSDNEKKQSPSKARLWLADTPEMFYVVDSKAIPSHLSASTNSGLARMKRYDGTSHLGGLLKKENVAYSVDNLALKMKRYNATSELSLYKNTVLKQTSSCAPLPAQSLPETDPSTEKHSPVAKNCINDGGHSSPRLACLESDDGHELGNPEDKKPDPSNQMISHGSLSNEQEKAQPATNGRYWFEEIPESFDAIERVQSANGSNSSDSTESTANVEHKAPSKEQKKTGLFSCWRVPLLKKHKKKQTRSDGLNEDQPSTVAVSTTANTLMTPEPVETVEAANPVLFTTLRECSTFFRVPYNPKTQPVPKFVWRPNEQISPASKKDLANAEKRMQMFLASKNLSMPGAASSGKPVDTAPSTSGTSTSTADVPMGSAEALKNVFAVQLPK